MDSKELVEQWREHGPATGATLLEIAVSAGMPDDKRVKWCRALQYASTVADRAFDHLAAQDARMEVLVGELFQAHVTWTQQVQALREDAATLRADLAKAKEALLQSQAPTPAKRKAWLVTAWRKIRSPIAD